MRIRMGKLAAALAGAVVLLLPVGAAYYGAHADLPMFFTPYRGGERLPSTDVVLQRGPRDCGLAALRMMLSLPRSDSGARRMEQLLRPSERGVSLRALQLAAAAAGHDVETWHVAPRELLDIRLPAIGVINHQHYVVVEQFEAPDRVVFVDPALGRVRLPPPKFQKLWSGPALILPPAWPRASPKAGP